jgi:hypothetical protein
MIVSARLGSFQKVGSSVSCSSSWCLISRLATSKIVPQLKEAFTQFFKLISSHGILFTVGTHGRAHKFPLSDNAKSLFYCTYVFQ